MFLILKCIFNTKLLLKIVIGVALTKHAMFESEHVKNIQYLLYCSPQS